MSPHALRALKDRTSDLHRRAEQYVRIRVQDATISDYARYLTAMLGFHAPLEERFLDDAELAAAGFDAAGRRKSHWLAHDLAAIAPCVPATPRCAALPLCGSLARRIGIAYVIEGSTLGGRFILSRLPPAIAAARGTATRFLEGYGAATGAKWRSFTQLAERGIAGAEADAIAGARDTFSHLIDWLARFEPCVPARVAEAS
jgi:heme oxygenase (biliverdin-IX-beta and delta-forming)